MDFTNTIDNSQSVYVSLLTTGTDGHLWLRPDHQKILAGLKLKN